MFLSEVGVKLLNEVRNARDSNRSRLVPIKNKGLTNATLAFCQCGKRGGKIQQGRKIQRGRKIRCVCRASTDAWQSRLYTNRRGAL